MMSTEVVGGSRKSCIEYALRDYSHRGGQENIIIGSLRYGNTVKGISLRSGRWSGRK
jgi:hypothetical protein